MDNQYRSYRYLGQQLKELIVSGAYPIGSRLMPEREIAKQYAVSRSLVREALIMLEIENLVSIKKGSGVYIINHPDLIANEAKNNDHGPFEILQARQVIESAIAACAAISATKADIQEIRALLEEERKKVNLNESGEENDHKFHILIARASKNDMMAKVIEEIWSARLNSPMWDKLHEHIEDISYRKQWLTDHENILNALQRRDSELARKEMWQHLENVKNTLMVLSDFDDPHFDGYLFETIPYQTIFESAKDK
ncbi:FCD domain-containing protein [Xenorhabdus sp. Flor]|uniref:FCD domain-containing protein n=1 Tax=Xenorhabdus cabanillasii TaxID=351673 RepID=UPI0019CDB9A2|nr:FCD domain-containing protein [Xenorhabdus sp. Flor]MBD2815301.1 FCD domain-containing protein [Xenorhabdus sp. Flor]